MRSYLYRRVVSWCSISYEIVSIKEVLQERYRFLALKEAQL
jgi:hypothetical protein